MHLVDQDCLADESNVHHDGQGATKDEDEDNVHLAPENQKRKIQK